MRFPLVLMKRKTLEAERALALHIQDALAEERCEIKDELRRTEDARERLSLELQTELLRELRSAWDQANAEARPGRHRPGVRERLRLEGMKAGFSYAQRTVKETLVRLGHVATVEEEVAVLMENLLPEDVIEGEAEEVQ